MRALVQRVRSASVTVEKDEIARIGRGLVVLLGVGHADGETQVRYLAEKIVNLRIFEDEDGKMNRSLVDAGGEALVVSQFTLYADSAKGRRPSFVDAATPEKAGPLVARFADLLSNYGVNTKLGQFGAHMLVEINNDGPVTIWAGKGLIRDFPERNIELNGNYAGSQHYLTLGFVFYSPASNHREPHPYKIIDHRQRLGEQSRPIYPPID